MTLGEAREIFDGWPDYPPLFLMLKGLVQGLSGGGEPTVRQTLAGMSDDELRALSPPLPIDDSELDRLSTSSFGQLPRLNRPDPDLEKMSAVFNLDEMRQKNLARRVAMAKRKKV